MTGADDGTSVAAADAGEASAALSGARLFPIGFALGAIAALTLFFGYRAVVPGGDGARPDDAAAPSVSAVAPATDGVSPGTSATSAQSVVETASSVDGTSVDDAPAYAAAGADVAAAAADAPALAGLEELASLSGVAGTDAGVQRVLPDTPSTPSVGSDLPSIDDPAISDLFGGPIMMVSSAVPRVIVLADGTSLVPGERLPGGHRIVDIRRERILLERDGVEWRLRIP